MWLAPKTASAKQIGWAGKGHNAWGNQLQQVPACTSSTKYMTRISTKVSYQNA